MHASVVATSVGGMCTAAAAEVVTIFCAAVSGCSPEAQGDAFVPKSFEGWTLWGAFLALVFGIGGALVWHAKRQVEETMKQTSALTTLATNIKDLAVVVTTNGKEQAERGEKAVGMVMARMDKFEDRLDRLGPIGGK